jgi:hypothetical protein
VLKAFLRRDGFSMRSRCKMLFYVLNVTSWTTQSLMQSSYKTSRISCEVTRLDLNVSDPRAALAYPLLSINHTAKPDRSGAVATG